MNPQQTEATFIYNQHTNQYECEGDWSIHYLQHALTVIHQLTLLGHQSVIINGKRMTHLDSAGALVLIKVKMLCNQHHIDMEWLHFTDKQLALIQLIESKQSSITYTPSPTPKPGLLHTLGKETIHKLTQVEGLLMLIGNLSNIIYAAAGNLKRFQVPSVISNVYTAGIQALPIIALLSFLIGIVLAYQMGLQLETYGANSFIAFLSGMACFREFAPLITAIIVAGRTSSSYTAQIGSMKINEELDAIATMGLSSVELLVLPKLLGLSFVFPLLIFWSDFFSILGAMFMSKIRLSVGYIDFLTRLQDSVGAKQLLLGLYKAPAFAILIALVGCFQGFNVEANATSIGSQTTKSVVQALFLIIIADAAYSIIYSWLHL